MKDKLNY